MSSSGSESLSDFLEAAQQQGSSNELNHGEFTLNRKLALRKLGSYLLERPEMWVVKLVQAAVAGGAAKVQFVFSRGEVEFRCVPRDEDWGISDLVRRIKSVELPKSGALRHLVLGLVGALGTDPSNRLQISYGAEVARGDNEGAWEIQTSDKAGREFVLKLQRNSKQAYGLRQRATLPMRYVSQQNAHEFKALVDSCGICPIPLWVDGLDIARPLIGALNDHLKPTQGDEPDAVHQSRTWLAIQPLELANRESQLRYSPHSLALSSKSHWELKERKASQHCHGFVLLGEFRQLRPRVVFTKDGGIIGHQDFERVFVGRREEAVMQSFDDSKWSVKCPFSFCLVVEAEDDEIDLASLGLSSDYYWGDCPLDIVESMKSALQHIKDNATEVVSLSTKDQMSFGYTIAKENRSALQNVGRGVGIGVGVGFGAIVVGGITTALGLSSWWMLAAGGLGFMVSDDEAQKPDSGSQPLSRLEKQKRVLEELVNHYLRLLNKIKA